MARERTKWGSARRHLTPVAEGGQLIVGTPAVTFRTAPIPDGVELQLWEDCNCGYVSPGTRQQDPAWSEWTEDPPRKDTTKRSLRYALSDPRQNSDGGLLGPNFYALGHFHSGDARLEDPGMTDLLIWTPLDVPNEAWELKRMGEKPTLPQAHHMTSLKASGFTVRTVRPCCLLSGAVDRWLSRLSGKPPLSQWAAGLTDQERHHARQRAARSAVLGAAAKATVAGAEATVAATAPARQLALASRTVGDPPGRPVDPDEPGRATAYLIPMPAGDAGPAVAELETWLRDHGFPPYTVPWPMRIVVGERVIVVWVNTGEPGQPGKPRPRTWRSSYLAKPFPDHVVDQLDGDVVLAPSMPGAMALTESARPFVDLSPEESR